MTAPIFFFDLGSPYAYLAAERLDALIAEPVQWQPISLGGLFKLAGRSSWGLAGLEPREAGIAEIERRAREYSLAPLVWPEPWPGNYLTAMRAATFAKREGVGEAFAKRAYRAAFQLGRDLSLRECVLEVAGEVGLEPQAVDAATRDPDIKLALREATDAAHELGVFGVPTLAIGDELFWGDDELSRAAERLRYAGAASSPR